jgi:molybdopterin/thiamine biosynthesis adenylyltransferase
MENYFARQELIIDSNTGLKINHTRILVIGVGAGGNEVLKNLALMGFGNFTIVDFDSVESSNLSRTTLFTKEDIGKSKADVAADVLKKISLHANPNITAINAKIQEVGKQVFLDNDIVVCCVDTANTRAYISDWCVKLHKPFFEMGFERFIIQISFFPNESKADSCLREIIGFGEFSGKRQSCSKLKMNDTNLQHIPTIQVAAAFAGVFVATEIILFLQGKSKLKNRMLQYSAEYHRCNIIDAPQSTKCFIHKDNELKIVESGLSNEATVSELLFQTKNAVNEECLLRLEDEFILTMDCEGCGKEIQISKFKSEVYDRERWCEECLTEGKYEEIPISRNWKIVREINLVNKKHTELLQMKLSTFSVKSNDLIRIDSLNDLGKSFLLKIN